MIATDRLALVHNGERIARTQLPRLSIDEFRAAVIEGVRNRLRLAALFGSRCGDGVDLYAVLANEDEGTLALATTRITSKSYKAVTPECTQAHLFEREIAEQFELVPDGHPWLKPVRFQSPLPGNADGRGAAAARGPSIGIADFYRMDGPGVHEVAVGPIHAGVIEPGHFRFQCFGEHVFHLEISLGYQHRGVERALVGGPNKRSLHLIETLAGDTTIAHATAYCEIIESLGDAPVPARAQWLRGIALELERLANHTGDLGALANDVGFLPTASYCGRLRGDFLNTTALLCGNRFGRSFVEPGGVAFDVDGLRADDAVRRVRSAFADVENAAKLLWDSATVMGRFEETGRVSPEACNEIGLVGLAARACGIERDVRQQFPSGMYRFAQIPVSTVGSGDVFARAFVRWLEIQRSVPFVLQHLQRMPAGPVAVKPGALAADQFVASLVEGWRGEVCHVALTDSSGRFERYKVVDPSFHNWSGMVVALRDQQISDFPLCNKSFNLSYSGHDL